VNHILRQCSYHLLPTITSAFILGITSTSFLPHESPPSFAITLTLFVLLLAVTVSYLLKKNSELFLLLLPLFFIIGFIHAQSHSSPPAQNNHIWNIIREKQEAIIVGTLAAMPGYNGKMSSMRIAAHYLRLKEWRDLTPVSGNILLRMDGPLPEQFYPGDTLVVRGEIKRPTGFISPGSFDFSRYLARRNIWITGFVRSPLFLRKIAADDSFAHYLRYLPEKIRSKIGRKIDAGLSPEVSSLYRAILLGDRSRISETVLEQFKASGIMHILAISGIHMGIIGALLFALFYRTLSLSTRLLLSINVKKSAALLCLPVLVFYAMLTGLNPPVIRSVIMSSAVIAAVCIDRKRSAEELLFLAAFLILIFSPLQLFTASFQLSFSAVAAIIFLLPLLKRLFPGTAAEQSERHFIVKMSAWAVAGLLVSVAATLATAPLSLFYFNRLSLIGPLANIIVEPLICLWSLSLGFMAIPFIFLLPPVANFLLHTGSYGLQFTLYFVHFCSSLPYASLRLPTPPPWLIFLYYLILLNLIYTTMKTGKFQFLRAAPLCIVIFLFFLPPSSFTNTKNRVFSISVLDVGQGSSTFLEFPSGYRALIDGGGSSYLSTGVGERVIAPYLWKKGISKIDAIIVTHPDADHYNGLPFIIKHFSPAKIWLNSPAGHDRFFKNFLWLAKKEGTIAEIATDNLLLKKPPEEIRCIANTSRWPKSEYARGGTRKENSGLIIRVCAQGTCMLFPGDIGKGIELLLSEKKYQLRCSLLLSSHHGSATSNSPAFLQAANPDYMIVSAGKGRRNIFPHPGLET